MRGPLLDCPTHGPIEDRSGISMVEGASIDLSTSTGSCPICGSTAAYLDGQYSVHQGKLHAVLRLSPAQAARIQGALIRAQQAVDLGNADDEVVERRLLKAVAKESPELLALVRNALRALTSERAGPVYALITLLYMMFGPQVGSRGVEITEDQIVEIVRQLDQGVENTPASPLPTQPTEPREPDPSTPRPETQAPPFAQA